MVERTVRERTFVDNLRQRLTEPLPGHLAHRRMSPIPRTGTEPGYVPPIPPRRGGVLILFYPGDAPSNHPDSDPTQRNDTLCLPLILRPTYDGTHSGQVSFPGGGQEEIDADITDTALREAYEEVGIPPNEVEVLGQLSKLYIAPSNFEVYPTVGWMARRPTFKIDPYEVARLLEVPYGDFFEPAIRFEEEWNLRGRKVTVPFFRIQGQTVWGATAMILGELMAVAGKPSQQ